MTRGLTLMLLGVLACAPAPDFVAAAGGEQLQGSSFGADHEAVFRGIPYAAAPVGDLRWRPPAPHLAREGMQPATTFGPACPQEDRLAVYHARIAGHWGLSIDDVPHVGPTSEDCLSLNLWTTNWLGDVDPHPVMVWIHGGSNTSGWGWQETYDGADLSRQGVVVVTINYRLGVLGFMAHPGLSAESDHGASGNYALLDQIAALEWVRDNISAFGGDPNRVTVFGESAGSSNIIHLMASPLADGLFHAAIAQSGAALGNMTPLVTAERRGERLAETAGDGSLASLRAVDADALVKEDMSGSSWGVIHDGWVLPESTGDVFEAGGQHDVPLLIGSNADEFTGLSYYLPNVEPTIAGFRSWLRIFRGQADAIAAAYPVARDEDVPWTVMQLTTDRAFTCPSRQAARAMRNVASDAYLYQFTRVAEGGDALGAFHGMEIAYVFDSHFDWVPLTSTDAALTETMQTHWAAFARTGRPNPEWPAYGDDESFLHLGDSVWVGRGLRNERCDALEGR